MKVKIYAGDITDASTDAIVNAANNELWMGSGVAGAIKRLGGTIIEEEAMAQGPIEVGEAVSTTAGDLPHTYIIHAAGMAAGEPTNDENVYLATLNSLYEADDLGLHSVAFPAIGAGVGGLTIEECAQAMHKAVEEFAEEEIQSLEEVHIVIFNRADVDKFKAAFK
ncbi:MAG: macro domain-containing protein [Candidatus Zixiibacteriota bacterium]